MNSENLEYAIEQFRNRLARSRDTIGFLYYTGHGCQLNHQGYLVPTNVDTTKKLKIKYHALNINKIQETLKEAGNRVNMLFLDACRDVPLGAKGSSKGLGQIQNTPKGTLVVYATQAGQIAKDNSNFINSIINTIALPNQSIRNLPYSISDAFKSADGQKPIFSAMEIPKIVLKSGYVPPVEPVQSEFVYVPIDPVSVPQTRRVEIPTNNPNIVKIGNIIYQNQPFTKTYTWEKAKEYCQGLTLSGYDNWRLPNRSELEKLLTKDSIKSSKGYTQYIRREFVENLNKNNGFWTSTTEEETDWNIWFFIFNRGVHGWRYSDSKGHVLCVKE